MQPQTHFGRDVLSLTVILDEVESLTAARAGALSGNEPSDALRVVNALLTQLDKLKHRKNVLVMSTSNLAKAIGASHEVVFVPIIPN